MLTFANGHYAVRLVVADFVEELSAANQFAIDRRALDEYIVFSVATELEAHIRTGRRRSGQANALSGGVAAIEITGHFVSQNYFFE